MTPAQRLAAIEKRRKKELETLQSLVTDESVDWLISRVKKLEAILKQYAEAEEDSPHKPQIARQALEE